MNKTSAKNNQSLFDIALIHYGDVRAAFDLALVNNLSITTCLEAGKELLLPKSDYENKEVVKYYQLNAIEPATSFTEESTEIPAFAFIFPIL